jgi:hypothetical protein
VPPGVLILPEHGQGWSRMRSFTIWSSVSGGASATAASIAAWSSETIAETIPAAPLNYFGQDPNNWCPIPRRSKLLQGLFPHGHAVSVGPEGTRGH